MFGSDFGDISPEFERGFTAGIGIGRTCDQCGCYDDRIYCYKCSTTIRHLDVISRGMDKGLMEALRNPQLSIFDFMPRRDNDEWFDNMLEQVFATPADDKPLRRYTFFKGRDMTQYTEGGDSDAD